MSGLILHLAISQSLVFLVNSRLGHFSVADSRQRPFSRSYRTILPSSLAMNLSSTCGFSPRPPVSVYGTGAIYLTIEVFLGSLVTLAVGSSVDSPYCHVRHRGRISLPAIYLHALTDYSVSPRRCHSFFPPSLYMPVPES